MKYEPFWALLQGSEPFIWKLGSRSRSASCDPHQIKNQNSYPHHRARIFQCLWGPGIEAKEWIPPALESIPGPHKLLKYGLWNYQHQYGRAGCVPFHSQQNGMDVQGVTISVFLQSNGRTVCRVYAFPPPVVWTCRLFPFSLSAGNAGCNPYLSVGMSAVRYRNEQKWRCQNHSCTGIRGPSPVPECSGTELRYSGISRNFAGIAQKSLQKSKNSAEFRVGGIPWTP